MYDKILLHYARLGPCGLSPVAPGTCGSLAAVILAPLVFMPLPFFCRVIFLIAVYISGVWAAGRAEEMLGQKDPKSVVVDELFGQWIVLLPFAGLAFWEYALAFALFRCFDILKPWPVSAAEKVPGGAGVMLDDGVAGLYALPIMAVVHWIAA